ncbi:MAG TPA: T9SS type A sorting domain-containing protein [Balneolales bacterium]|nr:T9SS type A sorting domain-containing protein [Balneolales bacterium]
MDKYNWGSGDVEAIRYLKINVSSNTTAGDIEYGTDGYWYYDPIIYVDAYGEMAMVFSRSGSSEYPSVLYTYSTTEDPGSMTSSQTLQAGHGYYDYSGGQLSYVRWGDYSGIALDPSEGDRFWLCGEFATSTHSNWGTQIGSITVPVPPLSVWISGSQYLDPGYSDDLTAWASGGVVPYQYNWQIRYMPRGYNQWLSWSYFGNQRKELLDYNSSYQEAETEVTVTDANNSNASNTFYIYYTNTSTVTALSDPTPNPFNPTTVLNYSLAKPAHVKLMIYNILGQQVATLVDANQAAGKYRKTFDASQLASGTYLERMVITDKSGKVTQLTNKLLLMK